jgi:hypothetical protein
MSWLPRAVMSLKSRYTNLDGLDILLARMFYTVTATCRFGWWTVLSRKGPQGILLWSTPSLTIHPLAPAVRPVAWIRRSRSDSGGKRMLRSMS